MTNTTSKGLRTKAALAVAAVLAASSLALVPLAKPAHAAEGTTFTVNSTNPLGDGICNSAECTLAEAINNADITAGADTINFNIPGSGVHTIKPDSELPPITERVTIDGYSQPGSKQNDLTQGTNAVLNIEIDGSSAGSEARGLLIGADASGTVVKGLVINRFHEGIRVPGSSLNRIEGNFIGTDPSGTVKRSNDIGIDLLAAGSSSDFNAVGSSSPAARNLISGNFGDGVTISDTRGGTEKFNRVEGNLIGTQKDGLTALANAFDGVQILSPNNAVEGNTIAFNGRNGVQIDSALVNSVGNLVSGNSIFSNGELGIDLQGDGVTKNDGDDPNTSNPDPDKDAGPNNFQNFPVISSAKTTKKGTTITGTLNSTPNTSFRVQFFSNASGDEGQKFLGETGVRTDASGNASFTFKPAQKVSKGQKITATTIDTSALNTSEFSAAKKVVRR